VTTVLVVDDDPAIRRTLAITLRARGYEVRAASGGRSALELIEESAPDVILLDLGLPDMDGLTVLRRVRGHSQVPIIVVSARTGSLDKVEALDQGADDFITKPFSIEELVARVRAATRRLGADEPSVRVEIGGLALDLTELQAFRDGDEVHLTPTEWKIIGVLARRPGRLVRQREILRAVWGPEYDNQTNYLRVHIASIRRKLEADPSRPTLFVTEPGTGYRFAPNLAATS
jgi:two-component system, OmpR family, KDP operon response regulator KdpE